MNQTTDILRGQLERHFDLEEMQALANDLLGVTPEEVGGQSGAGAFARALVDFCLEKDALEALADAIVLSGKDAAVELAPVYAHRYGPRLEPGQEHGGYRILKVLGDGGLGVVYLGEKKDGDGGSHRYAIKVMHGELSRDRSNVRRYLTALRAISAVRAPGIARIVDVGQLEDARPWVATEFVEGQTLAARLSRVSQLHINEARSIFEGVLQGLSALHARGLVHGDVKTGNVFMTRPENRDGTRGEPTGVLVDPAVHRLFAGGSNAAGAIGSLRVFGDAKGIAPEVARGGTVGVTSDLYAVGAMLYEVLTGRPPFVGETAFEVVAQHLGAQAVLPSEVAPRGWVNTAVDEFVLRALAKDPSGRFDSAAAMMEALASLGRVAAVSEEPTEELDEASFEQAASALKETPTDADKAIAVERVVEASRAFDRAADLFVELVASVEDVEDKKSLLFRAARLREAELGDHSGAETAYRQLLELDADDEIARIGLEECLRAKGDPEALAEALLEKAECEEDASERASVMREAAKLYEEELSDTDNAFVLWVQALVEDPSDDNTAKEIERLAKDSGDRWNDALTTLSEAVAGLDEARPKAALYVRMGGWYADQLMRPDFALPCYGEALKYAPDSDGAFDGTCALYRKAQSWQELVGLLLARVETASSPARARDFKAEAAEVLLDKLADTTQAETLFAQVLDEDPAHPKALEVLEDVYSGRDDHRSLARLLDTRAKNERGEARVRTLLRLAEIYEDRLSNIEKATISYESALVYDARCLPALKGLERIYAKTGRFAELLPNLQRQLDLVATPRQRVALYEQIGGIQEEEFVDHEKAVEAYEAVVAIDPGHEGANAALARLYRKMARFDALVETLDRHAKASEDAQRKTDLLLQAARTLTVDVGAPERAMSFCERVLAVDSENPKALELMAQLKAQSGDATAAVVAVERLAEGESDLVKKAALLVRAGRLLEDAGDKDRAIEHYKTALDLNPQETIAASALRTIYANRGDAHGAAELLLREIEVTQGSLAKARLLADLGLLRRDRLEEPTKAAETFAQALELDPTCTAAALGLAELAFAQKDFANAARYYEPLLSRTGDMTEEKARDLSVACGDAFRILGQEDKALLAKAQRAYLNAKAYAPDDREVLERLADVTFEAGEADEAAELYRDIMARLGDSMVASDRGHILYRQGEASRRAGDTEEARKLLELAIDLIPEEIAPYDALRTLHQDAGSHEEVVRVLRRRMEHAEDAERAQLLVEVGDVFLGPLGDRKKAAKSYVAALEIEPDDRNLLTKLMGVYSETKDWSRLVEVILRIADLVDDPKQLSKYYLTAASIASSELGRVEEAGDYYEQALENAPDSQRAFDGLVHCLKTRQAWPALIEAYRAQLDRKGKGADPKERAGLWDAIADTNAEHLADVSSAVDAWERAQTLDPEDKRRMERLAEVYAADPKHYFARAVEMQEALLQKTPYRVESYQALRQLYTDVHRADESFSVCQVLHALKYADADEEAFFKKHRAQHPAAAQEFFTEEIWFNHIVHPLQDPLLTGIFAILTPAVSSARQQELSVFGAGPKIDAGSDSAVMAQTLAYVAGVTQIELPDVHYRAKDPGGLSFMFTDPVSIGLGAGALAGGPPQALAFVAARHLSYLRPGHYLRHLVPTGNGLRTWLLAAIAASDPSFPIPPKMMAQVDGYRAQLDKHVPGPQKEQLSSMVRKLLAAAPELDMKKWVAAVDLSADRLGFVMANNLEMTAAVIKASPEDALPHKDRLRELYLYAASQKYMQLRHKLGIAIDD